MNKDLILQQPSQFDQLAQRHPDENEISNRWESKTVEVAATGH